MSTLRARPSSPLRFDLGRELRAENPGPALPASSAPHLARVTLPARSTEPLRVEDVTTGMAIGVQVRGAFNVVGQGADGYLVYPHAHSSGGTLLHRVVEDGAEDFVSFETRPAVPEVAYDLTLDKEVSGLRLVEGTLEMLDADGAPRLRAAPPFIVGADGVRTDATLAVEGCAVDTDPAAPWGRDVTPPGGESCILRVRWPDEQVQYPAVLDPRWQTTGSMSVARQDHVAILLSTGKVLVAGGRSTPTSTTGLASAELFDRTTNTWSTTGSMTTGAGRYQFTATQIGTNSNSNTSAHVLAAGGANAGSSLNTAQLYSVTAGTWAAVTTNLPAARSAHTATLLASGKVLLAAGVSGSTVLNTAVLYDPSTGTGTWTSTGNMPQAVKAHTATLLAATSNATLKNKVIVVGGNSGTASVGNVQLFDGTGTWSSLTALSSTREGHTATALVNGNVLITGGKSGSTILNTTQLFNAASGSGSWASAGTMVAARQLHTATLLPAGIVENGQVLLTGGNNSSGSLGTTELWNGTSTWTATTALSAAVQGQTATLLSNNMVLIAGGVNGSTTVATAALYDASFALACTSNSQCTTGFCVSGVCCDTACNGGCGVCNLAGKVGTCSAASSSTVCRAKADACDVAETCNGTSLTCPTDAVAVLGTVCRTATSVCDVPETCNGTTKACPADGFAPASTVCRASTGTCDATETCTGTSATCPADAFAPATTICRPAAGGCDALETCTGTSAVCPADHLAPAGTVCRAAESLCDVAETCSGSTATCPADAFAAAGTTCGAASNGGTAPVCSGSTGSCPVASGTSDVLGFEAAAEWALDPSDSGVTTIVGTNSNRTQGASSLEVTAQNFARFNSAPMSSIGSIGSLVLLDVLLPTSQANQFWFGDAQMFVSAPSLGINNVPLGDVGMTGLALGAWQTLAFQMPAATAASLAHGVYSDLTFSVVLNVPSNETGHYLLDNIRSIPDVVPSLLGIAQDGAIVKAVFDYQTTSSTPVNIAYGTANGLTNQSGFIAAPTEVPPTTFVPTTHAPFVATLSGSLLTWTVGSHSVTATPSSTKLPVTTLGDGTHDATLPDGRNVNIDSVPPPNPTPQSEPALGAAYNGTLKGSLSVGPSGGAIYTVPIALPPGVAGMAPNLGLVYNSQGGNGIAGQGWALAGLSIIHRCSKTRPQDGVAQAIQMTDLTTASSRDGFCLDGKRLFERSPGVFELESKDFSTISASPDYSSFTVVTKTGETRSYGSRAESQVLLPGPDLFFSTPDEIAVWALDRVVDAWGNYFDVHYNPRSTAIEGAHVVVVDGLTVSEIDYTGHLTGSTTDSAPFDKVTFSYEGRGDTRNVRFGPVTLPSSKRLTGITTPLGTYTLTYLGPGDPNGTDPMQPSRLKKIGYCAGATCLPDMVFDWDGGGYAWEQAPDPATAGQENSYALPAKINGSYNNGQFIPAGTQFVDLDGDGRLDFVLATADFNAKLQSQAWQNTGHGWKLRPDWHLPAMLAIAGRSNTGTRLGDIDGDGLPDLISDCIVYDGVPLFAPTCPNGGSSPTVWLNRLKQNGGWVRAPQFETLPSDWVGTVTFNPTTDDSSTTLIDMNADGLADLVRFGPGPLDLSVLLNTGAGWRSASADYAIANPAQKILPLFFGLDVNGDGVSDKIQLFHLEDVNRDGLPDLVPNTSGTTAQYLLINRGSTSGGQFGTVWTQETLGAYPGSTGNFPAGVRATGDVDGDGLFDPVTMFNFVAQMDPVIIDFTVQRPAVAFANGTGFSSMGSARYQDAIATFGPDPATTTIQLLDLPKYVLDMADLNGDGLADLIVNHPDGGQLLVNTGTTWIDANGATTRQSAAGVNAIPAVPIDYPEFGGAGSSFVDLDGDGITDLVQSTDVSGTLVTHAWLNKFRPPVIKGFPNGLANNSQVAYSVITTSDAQTSGVYVDDAPLDAAATRYLAIPVRVVSTVVAEDGTGTGATKTMFYGYHSLRGGRDGRGPLGFQKISVADQAAQVTTFTTFYQGYPYTGLVKTVERDQSLPLQTFTKLTKTDTHYCDSNVQDSSGNVACSAPGTVYPPGTSLFVYPDSIADQTFLHPEQQDELRTLTATSSFRYDDQGNPVLTTVTTNRDDGLGAGESSTRQTTNVYGSVGSPEQMQGKVTLATVTTSSRKQPSLNSPPIVTPAITHTTGFNYVPANTFGGGSNTLALVKEKDESGADWPIRLDIAFAYDQFGNVITTTSCASDFEACLAGAPGAVNAGEPMHPPFRTTSTSYDPGTFNAPHGSGLLSGLSYGAGRFPVRTTNAAGQSEFMAYDPIKGVVLQKTGPNGINSCFTYDDLGRQMSGVERCGSSEPVLSTTGYFVSATGAPPQSRIVAVTHSATGATTWAFSDDQGKATGTLTRSFSGGFIETLAAYNALGQIAQVGKPFLTTDQPRFATTTYDAFNRPFAVTDDLGITDASNTDRLSTITTIYDGPQIGTKRVVNGATQTRTETKNAIAKVEAVIDANGVTVFYGYDSDGNLACVDQNGDTVNDCDNNLAVTPVRITYDIRGRKSTTFDPDMGTWHYVFDGFGDLVSQTDAKGKTTTMAYDLLGRMISKSDEAGTAQWVYDVAPGAGVGKLAAMISVPDDHLNGPCAIPFGLQLVGKRSVRSFSYTALGEVQQVSECADGDTFVTSYQYDTLGRQSLVRYPQVGTSQLAVGYHYTSLGFLQYLTDESSDYSVLWRAKAMNALGQVTDEQTQNGVETISTRNPQTGWLLGSIATAHADHDNVIQNWSYGFDEIGNLLARNRADAVEPTTSQETFTYDLLNRVTSSQIATSGATHSEPYSYDALGNVTEKGGNIYAYGAGCLAGTTRPAGPHAVCTVAGGARFTYDENGNLTGNGGRTVSYTPTNKVASIESEGSGNPTIDFMYGADDNRVVQVATNGSTTSRTVYVGLGATGKSLYERTTMGSDVKHVNFIYAGGAHGGNAFALRVLGSAVATKYYSFDHLGSVTAMSDEEGRVTISGADATVLGYDAWGARRNPDGTAADPASFSLPVGHREFTGHEQIPDVGLVNMNGRVYDPTLGRFLSPDPNVQFASDLQSYNRYSYVLNNPLRLTDPTGYFLDGGIVDTLVEIGLAVGAIAACTGPQAFACTVIFTLTAISYQSAVMANEGATTGQILAADFISVDTSFMGGSVGDMVGKAADSAIIGGAVSGAVSAAISTAATGGSWEQLGQNVLVGATEGAALAGFRWELRNTANVTQAQAHGVGPNGALRDRSGNVILLAEGDSDPDAGVPDVPADMGGSQHCEDLLDKIQDRVDELKKRAADLEENKLNLPATGKMSIEGHQQQFEGKQTNLRTMLDEWNSSGCGSGLPADAWSVATMATPSPVRGSNTVQNSMVAGAATYAIYRVIRMIPSVLLPPAWPTIAPNAVVP